MDLQIHDGCEKLEDNKRHHHSGVAKMTLEPEFSFLAHAFRKKDSKTGCCRTYIWKTNRIRSAFHPRRDGFFISEESLGSFGKKREFPFFNGFRAAISDRAWKEWRIRLKLMSRGYLYMENESDKFGFSSKAGWLFASPKNPWVRLVKKESFLFSMGFEWRYWVEHEESGENVKNSCRADT